MANRYAREPQTQGCESEQGRNSALLELLTTSPSLSSVCRELRCSGATLRRRAEQAGLTGAYEQCRRRGIANDGVYSRGIGTLTDEQLDAVEFGL